MEETRSRAIAKAVTYRLWQSLNTFLIALIITKDFSAAGLIVTIEVIVKMLVYFWHERIWNMVKWGRK